ncbi:metallophosphoesterase [Virgibacillus necropolis]|uniref:Metallophosphoesterase n=1 Tax=Virgibacillus necropolis TaxID=163877 RepID=A0A221MFJ3_9BACI|nr:metallophosphoesterase [Virgibacillus necropolis]ASN06443.1 metallophosphoesterase [Virgibacillus necropolis]
MYIIITIFTVLVGYFLYKGYKNTHSVEINHIKIENEPQTNGGTSLRVLHISDMHIENISMTPKQLYEKLKGKPIDIIALTGDFLDRKRSIPRLIPYLQVLNRLKPVYGAYAVFGNHDYVLNKQNFNQLKETLNEHGFKTLQNENDRIDVGGNSLNIIGIDNFGTNHSNLGKTYDGLEKGYNLVLTHDPNIVLTMKDYHFDYLLSGHFHGGQIHWPKPYHLFKMGNLIKMNMVKGLHQYNGRSFYISEGLGQTGINIRVGSRPEITIHDLHIHQINENNRVEFKDSTTKAG